MCSGSHLANSRASASVDTVKVKSLSRNTETSSGDA
ncbi:Uncharacterised protein [Mycobacteroides abscessus subsp. abscessus]|nr:Uncharacterised protein [Mycobacteroides abscessus subsp. abscessus]